MDTGRKLLEQAREVKNKLCLEGHQNAIFDKVLASTSPDETWAYLTQLAHLAVDESFAAIDHHLKGEPEAPQAAAQPVAEVIADDDRAPGDVGFVAWTGGVALKYGTKLYAAPSTATEEVKKWVDAFDAKQHQFMRETLRTSELAALLRAFADQHRNEHSPGPWSRGCTLCKLVGDADALFAKPINVPPFPREYSEEEGDAYMHGWYDGRETATPPKGEPQAATQPVPQGFIDWFGRNYYGDVVFSSSDWHARSIFRNAMYHARATPPKGESNTPAEPAWQPIETAPTHGTILLWWRHAGATTGGFRIDESWTRKSKTPEAGWAGEADELIPRNQEDCTHWMPLPTPPAAQAKDSKQ